MAHCGDHPDMSILRPGLVVLVAFDPAARSNFRCPTMSWRCARHGWPRFEEYGDQRAPSTANVISAPQYSGWR